MKQRFIVELEARTPLNASDVARVLHDAFEPHSMAVHTQSSGTPKPDKMSGIFRKMDDIFLDMRELFRGW